MSTLINIDPICFPPSDKLNSEDNFKTCSKCKEVFFCSRSCQRQSWRTQSHRIWCELSQIRRRGEFTNPDMYARTILLIYCSLGNPWNRFHTWDILGCQFEASISYSPLDDTTAQNTEKRYLPVFVSYKKLTPPPLPPAL